MGEDADVLKRRLHPLPNEHRRADAISAVPRCRYDIGCMMGPGPGALSLNAHPYN